MQAAKIMIGGLLRCCIATVDELAKDDKLQMVEGETITCHYCKRETMVFRDGAYRWNRKSLD